MSCTWVNTRPELIQGSVPRSRAAQSGAKEPSHTRAGSTASAGALGAAQEGTSLNPVLSFENNSV